MTEVKGKFQVMVECPRHRKNIYIIVDADSLEEAEDIVLGRTYQCVWGGAEEAHEFVVEKVLGVSVYPWVPPVTVSTVPMASVVVKEMTTSDLGERFWILSRKGQSDFEEIKREVSVVTLTPTPTPRRGSAGAGSAVLIALLVIGVSAGGYYLWKRFKGS